MRRKLRTRLVDERTLPNVPMLYERIAAAKEVSRTSCFRLGRRGSASVGAGVRSCRGRVRSCNRASADAAGFAGGGSLTFGGSRSERSRHAPRSGADFVRGGRRYWARTSDPSLASRAARGGASVHAAFGRRGNGGVTNADPNPHEHDPALDGRDRPRHPRAPRSCAGPSRPRAPSTPTRPRAVPVCIRTRGRT